MARTATIYRIQIELSDVDRSTYESLTLRVARHPSEDPSRLVARVLAYCLLFEDRLEFGRGLSDVDEPALWVREPDGRVVHWIDVGQPGAERLHRASKRADRVTVVCHRSLQGLEREVRRRDVHGADAIEVYVFPPELVDQIASSLDRNSSWTVIRTGDDLQIAAGDHDVSGSFERTTLARLAGGP